MTNPTPMPNPVEANYAVWNADSVVSLHNVPWNNDYRDIVGWDGDADRESWFNTRPNSAVTRIEGVSYARINQPIRLEIPFSTAYQYNYVRVQNGPQGPVNNLAQSYYYFITGIEQNAPGTTFVTVQLDVWTTFGNRVNFGSSYVERGHIGIANENGFNNFGRDFLTVPEGMDIGGEYQTVHHVNHDVMHLYDDMHISSGLNIMVVSTTDWETDPGTVKDPHLNTAKGEKLQGLPSGASYYVFNSVSEFQAFMSAYSGIPWITQSIISITAVPPVSRYSYTLTAVKLAGNHAGVRVYRMNADRGRGTQGYMMQNWRNSPTLINNLPAKYRKLRKFFTFPYMAIEMTTFNGSPLIMRPESWNDPDGWYAEKAVLGAPNQRIMFWPVKYNAGRGSTIVDRYVDSIYDDNGEYLDAHTQVSNLPTFALVNNGYLAAMSSNAHGIAQQYQSADWSQQRALQSNATSYDQANNSIMTGANNGVTARNAAIDLNTQANSQNVARTIVSGATGLTSGALGAASAGPGALAGAAIGAASGAANAYLDIQNRNANLGITNSAAAQTQANTQSNQQFLADTNKGLADWAAKGDYQNSINAINAKVQDARLTQPSVSGQQGGETFALTHGGINLSFRFKMLSYNAMCIIGDFWLRYGYAVHRFISIDKLKVMSKFTYWKLSETYLYDTRLPEFIKQAIRGIFEKGVTVWTDPADIGRIDISDNEPLSGIVIPVDPDPAYVPPEDQPVIPNPDTEDKMYLINTDATSADPQFWALGKDYLANLNTVGSGITVPIQLVGESPHVYDSGAFSAALNMCGVPDRYIDRATFLAENPDGVYSKENENAKAIDLIQSNATDNFTALNNMLTAILQTVAPADGTGAE